MAHHAGPGVAVVGEGGGPFGGPFAGRLKATELLAAGNVAALRLSRLFGNSG